MPTFSYRPSGKDVPRGGQGVRQGLILPLSALRQGTDQLQPVPEEPLPPDGCQSPLRLLHPPHRGRDRAGCLG